jgi:predicted pyridoxine 5'-phosphate oxidase superfamily flavin-nucleotide-binding protein
MAQHYLSHVAGLAAAQDRLGPEEQHFISQRDSFYLASLTETGWPYVQHRGGPAGFLRVLDEGRLGFADVRGNRQLISTGNVAADSRVSLFLVDYAARERLKILGRARMIPAGDDAALAAQLTPPELARVVERLVVIEVVSFDWNCPKYITPRYTKADIDGVVARYEARIRDLETRLAAATPPT